MMSIQASDACYFVRNARTLHMKVPSKLINNGEEKLRSELDVVKILHSIRKLEIMTSLIMSDHQIAL